MATLRTMLGSETVYAHCEAYLLRHGRPCSHSAILHIPMLAERLGWDFDLIQHRSWFIARLRCSRCGAHRASIIFGTGNTSGGGDWHAR